MRRRGSEDEQWQEVKAKVKKRDKGCRFLKVLTPQEFFSFKRVAGSQMDILDPAHVLGAGPNPSMIYVVENVVLLNRFAHDRLDYFKDPLTGKRIDKETHEKWWRRIVGDDTYNSLIEMSRDKGEINVRSE